MFALDNTAEKNAMAEQTKFWYLKNFNFFEGMDEATMDRINSMAMMSTVQMHKPIYFPDQPSNAVFLLKSGHVKISRVDAEGKEMILSIIGPGEVFGELALFEEASERNELAESLDETVICTIRRTDFEDLIRNNPELNFRVTKRIGLRLRQFEERIGDLLYKDAKMRVASFLINYAEEFGRMKGGIITICLHLTHQEISLVTGTTRQTVTTTLNEFRSEGVIDFSRKGMTIINYPRLQTLAR